MRVKPSPLLFFLPPRTNTSTTQTDGASTLKKKSKQNEIQNPVTKWSSAHRPRRQQVFSFSSLLLSPSLALHTPMLGFVCPCTCCFSCRLVRWLTWVDRGASRSPPPQWPCCWPTPTSAHQLALLSPRRSLSVCVRMCSPAPSLPVLRVHLDLSATPRL